MKSQQVLLKTLVCDCKITEHYTYTISYGLLFNLFGILIVCACLFHIDLIMYCYRLCLLFHIDFMCYSNQVKRHKEIHYQIPLRLY